MLASGALDVAPLISHRFKLDDAEEAYELLSSGAPSLGILLQYPGLDADALEKRRVALTGGESGATRAAPATGTQNPPRISFIGAGNYAGRVLIPAFKSAGAVLQSVASGGGVSATHFGRKYGFAEASSDWQAAVADPETDAIVIATRHNAHARQVVEALRAKNTSSAKNPSASPWKN